ncbi:hypothetical protein [Halopseudomonas maritima]|uniref:hypothetical protein n=1 Tax=Halopseudomonas maritima TaxID=2918528 RepID=UPI001EECA864|nr:hypothetical protein [Halopseudomonas maritima]UJJ32514.1 hypothetical protein HV822_04950 [Halopseudomonas maritima]
MTTAPRFLIASRVLAAIFGVYAFVWGVIAMGMAGFSALGVAYHSAEQGMLMLGLLLYVALFIWVFSVKSLWRVWLILGVGAALTLAVAWQLQRMIIG